MRAARTAIRAVLCAALAVSGVSAAAAEVGQDGITPQTGTQRMNIQITIGTQNLAATLDDNPTSREFAALLPLTLTLRDFNAAEKISDELPQRLTQAGAPEAAAGVAGDIAFYAPWGNLALFYRPGPHARGLIKMGRITSGLEPLSRPGSLHVTISRTN